MSHDQYLNAAIAIKAVKRRRYEEYGDYVLTEDEIQSIKDRLTKHNLELDDEQIRSGWECLSHI